MSGVCDTAAPTRWEIKNLSEVVEINPRFDKAGIADNTSVSFVPMPAVEAESGVIDVSVTKPFSEVKKGYTGFLKGDVLFAKITPCMENGKMAVVPELTNGIGFGSTEFHVLRPKPSVLAKYIYYFVSSKQFRADAEHNMTGAVGQKRVPKLFLENAKIPVPPIDEQKDIVELIEELLSKLDKGIESLKTAREQLKVYRQAVLKHAFEGKLTAQWREDNKDKLESPKQLLARIQREREARYQQQLEEWKAAVNAWEAGGKEGKKPGKPIKPKQFARVTNEESAKFGKLPTGWIWVRIGELALVGTGVTPLKSNTAFYADGDIPWVTSGALNEAFVREPSGYITVRALNETNLRLFPVNTLVVALYGEGKTRGKCSELAIEATTNQAIAGIILEGTSAEFRRFLKWFLVKNYEAIRLGSSGGVQPNLNLGIIETTAFPLSTVGEAQQISDLLDVEFSKIDQLESEIDLQMGKAETLRQSILKKAFYGQFSLKDSNNQPACNMQ